MRELILKTALLVTFTLTLVTAAKGQAAAAIDQKATAFVLCKSQKNVRTIRIIPEKAESCTITYSKGGNEEVVGANRSLRTCKSILKSIQTNLESAKWNCRNVETAHLTTSGEAL